jgi:hypothetical protein
MHLKIYTGLDDALLQTLEPALFTRVNEADLRFEEIIFWFMPPEAEQLEHIVKRLGKLEKRRFAADLDLFDPFFETLLAFKEARGIVNSSTALRFMCEIVSDWIEQQEIEQQENGERDAHPSAGGARGIGGAGVVGRAGQTLASGKCFRKYSLSASRTKSARDVGLPDCCSRRSASRSKASRTSVGKYTSVRRYSALMPWLGRPGLLCDARFFWCFGEGIG